MALHKPKKKKKLSFHMAGGGGVGITGEGGSTFRISGYEPAIDLKNAKLSW